jgi:hypothetical protein
MGTVGGLEQLGVEQSGGEQFGERFGDQLEEQLWNGGQHRGHYRKVLSACSVGIGLLSSHPTANSAPLWQRADSSAARSVEMCSDVCCCGVLRARCFWVYFWCSKTQIGDINSGILNAVNTAVCSAQVVDWQKAGKGQCQFCPPTRYTYRISTW